MTHLEEPLPDDSSSSPHSLLSLDPTASSDPSQSLLGTPIHHTSSLEQPATPPTKSSAPARPRLLSLDILRGLTVFCMIIVNNQPGNVDYWSMAHAEFWGLSPTDFIFPFFLFIMGYAMGIVFSRHCRNPDDVKICCCGRIRIREGLYWHLAKWGRILRRTVLLWLLGFGLSVIGNKFDFRYVRFPGVLQRIAFCYFCISVLLNCVPWISVQSLIILTLHVLYIVVMYCFPNPVCGNGVVLETCSAQGFFDVAIFGKNHIYQKSKYFDPEGSISSLTSLSTTYLGVVCFYLAKGVKNKYKAIHIRLDKRIHLGSELKESSIVTGEEGEREDGVDHAEESDEEEDEASGIRVVSGTQSPERKGVYDAEDLFDMADLEERKADLVKMEQHEMLLTWAMFGGVLIFIGIVIDLAWMQYNKHIWSSSFVFVTAGSASVALAYVALIVDVWGWKCWAYPFWWAGVNPLFMYVAPEYIQVILDIIPTGTMSLYHFFYHWIFQSWIKDDRVSGALFGLIFECLFLPWAGLLFWRKCYIKL